MANDLARVTLGISTDTVTNANYRGLTGSNVVVEVNDTGVDATHPDFSLTGNAGAPGANPPTRVFGLPLGLVDVNGHGTHVAGVIAGNGSESYSVINTPQGSVTNADFRGKAPAAKLYSFAALDDAGFVELSDYFLQSVPATNNALISNNSWTYGGDNTYNLSAASYDAAVRDALPLVTGSQPVLFVFAAGNDGGGSDGGGAGDPDTILSPGTAKDVITVGALEQERNITNIVTDMDGSSNAVWQAGTDSGFQVASYSARGNVGIGSEGTYGRFKPDVVAPGSFVVSTRSVQWDEAAYYNPTNYYYNVFVDQLLEPSEQNNYPGFYVPQNAVSVTIQIVPNASSPVPFPKLPIYVSQNNYPIATNPGTYDFVTINNQVSIPPDGGGGYLAQIQGTGFNYSIGNSTNIEVDYDVVTIITTTNDYGNYYQVLSNLNETITPYYRYESGTSIAAPAVSGSLALFQDYFTNTLHSTPSPALLKALLINGARAVGNYNFVVTNDINFQGWGLASVPNSLPFGMTNVLNAACSSFFLDQSPTNALATGGSQTFQVSIVTNSSTAALSLPLRVTLAWTDPPGNPAAAIKLVNNLDLMVSNNVTGEVYFGNDIPRASTFNAPWDTNTVPNLDAVNNVENVFLDSANGGSFTVTLSGRSVNVNAVTAQTNNAAGTYAPNVVQDYTLVISSGNGEVTNALTVAVNPAPVLAGPLVSFVTTTNTLLMNQLAGGNAPLLGTNTVGAGAGYATNALITLGMTNQWHFYVVTNNGEIVSGSVKTATNAAFVTFLSQTLATPRMGVFATERQNPTQPEADVDVYVSTDPTLTNLNPVVISNCVFGAQVGASIGTAFNGASLGNSTGTEFVVDTNSAMGRVYYIGVKSETEVAANYALLPVFSEQPFSEMRNGAQFIRGLLLPVNIPDGNNAHPGMAYVFALAIYPIQIQNVVISNQIVHQNFGDLVGVFTHGSRSVVLNNHDGTRPPGINNFIYNDGPASIIGSQPPDGPGSLQVFQGQQGIGPWILTEVDDSITQTGAVTGFSLLITPHQNLNNPGINISVDAFGYFYGFIDMPAGVTNLTISATNTTLPPDMTAPSQLFVQLNAQPTLTNYDKMAVLTNFPLATPTTFPGASISIGPSDAPPIQPGRYFVTLFNPSPLPQTYFVIANFQLGQLVPVNFGSSGPVNLLDDAVTYSSLFVTNTQPIATVSVGLRVEHPRISDLVFHLINPDGTRFLLMENRGGTSTSGAGVTIQTTNIVNVAAAGGSEANTNFMYVGVNSGTLALTYDFYELADQMTVYASTNPADFSLGNAIWNTTLIPGSGQLNIPFTTSSGYLTIIMNQFGNPAPTTQWTYKAGGVQTNFYYLTLTQDTNLTTTPIKFAPPPFVPTRNCDQFCDSRRHFPQRQILLR